MQKHIKPINSFTKHLHYRVANSMFVSPATSIEIITNTNSLPSKQSYGYAKIPMSVKKKGY